MRRRRFARRAISRFMPGEDTGSALRAAEGLRARGLRTALACLGENVTSPAEAADTTRHYEDVLDRAHEMGLQAHISLKPTHLGLDLDPDATCANLSRIVERASRYGTVVWVDMEASPYIDRTLELYERVQGEHSNVGVCVQAYLRRTATDVQRLLERNGRIRLVKGAYDEPASIAFRRKRDVDANFLALARDLLRHVKTSDGAPPGIATHDVKLIERVQQHAQEIGLDPAAFEVQMLYGIRREDQERLAHRGLAVRVLISYGDAWFPWYMRRLAERPANVAFVLKSLVAG